MIRDGRVECLTDPPVTYLLQNGYLLRIAQYCFGSVESTPGHKLFDSVPTRKRRNRRTMLRIRRHVYQARA